MRAIVLVVVLLVTAGSASAAPPHERYGSDVVAVDAIGASLLGGGVAIVVAADSDGAMWGVVPIVIGGALYIGGGLALHARHHNDHAMHRSPWLKIALPLVGAFAGAQLWKSHEDLGAVIGVGSGIVLATTIDAAFLAHAQGLLVLPSDRGAMFGFAARF